MLCASGLGAGAKFPDRRVPSAVSRQVGLCVHIVPTEPRGPHTKYRFVENVSVNITHNKCLALINAKLQSIS